MRGTTLAAVGAVCLICVFNSATGFNVDREHAADRAKRSMLDEFLEPLVPAPKKKTDKAEKANEVKEENSTGEKKADEATEKKTRDLEDSNHKSLRNVKTNEDERLELLIRELLKDQK